MAWPFKKAPVYQAPRSKQAHRGFVYLDNDVVINSLSAMESGKVDEIVEKINLANERGLSVGASVGEGGASANATAGSKSNTSLQAEVIRRRTRFSIFETWYETLERRKAIGRFSGWGPDALSDVQPGQTVEIRGEVELVPMETVLRMFLWWAEESLGDNPVFPNPPNPADIKKQVGIVKVILGGRDDANATLTPLGDPGPTVGATFSDDWMIEPIGRWGGTYTLIAQVEEVLSEGERWQTMRVQDRAPLTTLEATLMSSMGTTFEESAKNFGLTLVGDQSYMPGPALVLRPIALFR